MFDYDNMNKAKLNRKYIFDILLLAVIVLLGALLYCVRILTAEPGNIVYIKYRDAFDEEESLELPIDDDCYIVFMFTETPCGVICDDYVIFEDDPQIPTGEYNVLHIHNNQVTMCEASCPDLICVHTKMATNINDSIVCLPHRLIVTVSGEGSSKGDVDAVTW